MPAEKDYRNLVSLLKHLKPILDDVADHEAPQDEALSKECEELDIAVNEAREFLEKWSPRTSKLLFVLRSKPYVRKIQISSIKLSRVLHGLSESLPTNSTLSNAQLRVQESQNLKVGQLSDHIEEILRRQKEGKTPDAEHLMEIIVSFNLGSSQELLTEFIALENEKQKAQDSKMKGDLDQISQTVDLMSHVRDCVVELGRFKALNGIQVPSYFRCPLSLELMLDPVIVASGQTYERAAIQKWLDHGLVTCPKTGFRLSHKNLIPNYTVKALIANWCSENRVELSNNPDGAKADEVQCRSENISCEDDRQSQTGNSIPRSSNEVGHGFETEKVNEGYRVFREETEKLDQFSPEHSYVHSRSESASSAVSSIDYVPSVEIGIPRISIKQDNVSDRLPPNEIPGPSPSLSGQEHNSSNTMVVNGNHDTPRTLTFTSESSYNELTSTSHVEKLVNDLKSVSTEVQTAAAGEIRFLAKYNMENRLIIGQSGAIAPLISLLHSDVKLTQEHAVTALLNLSINESIKARIAEEGALEPLIHVLRTGNAGAKENAAAALFSISLLDEYRIKIGRSGAVKELVHLLGSGTFRGKKDAATALFNLSIFHENKVRIVQAGAVKYLVRFLDPATEMVDKAVALLANLSTVLEGCSAIAREGGIPLLVEVLETGSTRGKENAASILLQLCINSPKYCRSILQEGAVPPLVALSQSGTPRAKEKAQQLLSHFRSQRETATSRGRP
ncbi:U-box domain-containing protein 3 [Sesamum alatum]|uniref:RING-type E3 ubiquitin transferase n=1 Tax=Sesamum alatum TaxID=300844 RepID=A0AAE1XUX6_9LAMI|nr:U-box domain-containing protein 3 [Sesamum alatum]